MWKVITLDKHKIWLGNSASKNNAAVNPKSLTSVEEDVVLNLA